MLGLGETKEEVLETIQEVRNANVDIITIGQYLQPTKNHLPVKRFVELKSSKNIEFCRTVRFSVT